MKKFIAILSLTLFFAAAASSNVHASQNYLLGSSTSFESTYPSAKGSAIDSCTLCHTNTMARNPYGTAYANAGHNFAPIESADSDGDGFTNIAEISALTFPGDPDSKPSTPPPNTPPAANAGPDQTVTGGTVVTLNGSNSTDPGGTIASYAWRQTAGPTVTLTNPGAAIATFTAPAAGTGGTPLTFQLTVTDNGGLSSSDTCVVNVTAANQPPVANAGADQTVNESDTVTLNASNSSDPDGTIASYGWLQTAGPSVTLSSSTSAQPTFIAPNVGAAGASLTFQLTVTDNKGLQATDSCIVNVSWVNAPPVANAGPDQTVNVGAAVALNGSGSSDSDNGIASYQWSQTAGTPVTLSNAAVANPTFTAPDVGTGGLPLNFQLTVKDNGGLSATDTCVINVTPATPVNRPPVANAGPDQAADSGTTVTLDGSASTDPENGIVSYLWSQTAGPTVTLSDPTDWTPTFTAPDVGTGGMPLTFQLTVKDSGGLTGTDTCIVNVVPAGDPMAKLPPEADAGQDQRARRGATVTLDGSNSRDPDGSIVSYEWKQIRGRPVTLSASTADKPTFRAPRQLGALTFRLTVTDEDGLRSSDTCVVYISGDNRERRNIEHEDD